VIEADIRLVEEARPFHKRAYRQGREERLELDAEIERWREGGIIQDTESPYSSPVFHAKKRSDPKKKRVIVDFRWLNAQTVEMHWPIPDLNDELMELHDTNLFSTLDFLHGFLQVPIRESARYLTVNNVLGR
jgi:hypothetical protein